MLQEEWSSCTACELGAWRKSVDGHFVFGEGTTRGVLFIGEGPGVEEEASGRPFIGKPGRLLRKGCRTVGLENFYITNAVACRSCEPVLDDQGQPRVTEYRGRKSPLIADKAPLPSQLLQCRPRLLEQIYLVDPVLIVTLGANAASSLLGRKVSITQERGVPEHVEIPGALYRPSSLGKRQVWVRRSNGQRQAPVEQNTVRYVVLPTLHPSFVLQRCLDAGDTSPSRQFMGDLRTARKIFDRYCVEVLHEPERTYGPETEGELNVEDD